MVSGDYRPPPRDADWLSEIAYVIGGFFLFIAVGGSALALIWAVSFFI